MTNVIDWKRYMSETFYAIWEKKSAVDLTDYDFLIRHHFDMETIEAQIIREINNSLTPYKTLQSHRENLQCLIEKIIDALLTISDDGKHITNKNIELAKQTIFDGKNCPFPKSDTIDVL